MDHVALILENTLQFYLSTSSYNQRSSFSMFTLAWMAIIGEVIRQWKDVKIEVNKISRVRYIGGKPVTWIQHEADYIKLRELFHHGGISMDSDVIIVNATRLKYEQRLSECIISEEGEYINIGFQSCIKNSPFIKKWLEGYDTDYRPHLWLPQWIVQTCQYSIGQEG